MDFFAGVTAVFKGGEGGLGDGSGLPDLVEGVGEVVECVVDEDYVLGGGHHVRVGEGGVEGGGEGKVGLGLVGEVVEEGEALEGGEGAGGGGLAGGGGDGRIGEGGDCDGEVWNCWG